MKTFKSIPDLEQLRSHPLHDTVESLVVQVIQSYTEYRVVGFDLDMPWRLSEVPFALRTKHETRSTKHEARSTKHEASYKKLLLPSPSALNTSTKFAEKFIASLNALSHTRSKTITIT
jgi:hypothetical protein